MDGDRHPDGDHSLANCGVRHIPGVQTEIADIGDIGDIKKELADLGPLTTPEKKVVVIQSLMVAFWIAGTWVPAFNVVTVGVFGATAMFLPGIRLFTWKEAQAATGWDILMMAGAVTTLGAASSPFHEVADDPVLVELFLEPVDVRVAGAALACIGGIGCAAGGNQHRRAPSLGVVQHPAEFCVPTSTWTSTACARPVAA